MKSSRVALGLVLLGGLASATTLLAQDVDALSREADAIVRGHVRHVAPRWTKDHTRIITDVDIEVAETLKGAPPQSVTVMQPGGEIGEVGQRVEGVAGFSVGEEVVVFLEKKGERFGLVGMAHGKFRVERSAAGAPALARPEPEHGAMLIDPQTRQPTTGSLTALPLEELKAKIRATLLTATEQPGGRPVRTLKPVSP